MLKYASCFVIACVAHLAGCSDPSSDGEVKFGRLIPRWERRVAEASYDAPIGQKHYLAFDGGNRLVAVQPHYQDPDVEQGCAAILKFSEDGTQIDTLHFDKSKPPMPPFQVCPSREFIALDNSDSILTGSDDIIGMANGESFNELFLRKLDAQGQASWTQYHYRAVGYSMYLEDMIVDSKNNVIVAATGGPLHSAVTRWISKYDPQGNALWTHELDPGASRLHGVAVDETGNIWYVFGDEASDDTLLGKLDPLGNTLVTIRLGNVGYASLKLAPDGSPIVFYGTTLKKYSMDGAALWEAPSQIEMAQITGVPQLNPYRIAVAPDGSVYGIGDGLFQPPEWTAVPKTILVKYRANDGRLVGIWEHSRVGDIDLVIAKNGAIAVVDNSFIRVFAPVE